MSKPVWLLRVRQSVFAKLVVIMLMMAASLLVLVVGFFLLYLSPVLDASIDPVVQEYARRPHKADTPLCATESTKSVRRPKCRQCPIGVPAGARWRHLRDRQHSDW